MEPTSEPQVEPQFETEPAPQLAIRLLGEFLVAYQQQAVGGLGGDRPQSLLAYLLLHRDAPQSRRYLSFLLWPDSAEGQARSNLRNLFFALRQALPHADAYLASDATTIQWRVNAPYTLDVADFRHAVAEARRHAQSRDDTSAARWLEVAVSSYGGDLLPGCYDDWLIAEREQLRQEFAEALSGLVALRERQGDYVEALRPAQRLLQADPLNEAAYVQLMRLHAQLGDRAAVQRLYQNCVMVLERELDVEPSPATQKAYQEYMRLAPAPPRQLPPSPVPIEPPPPPPDVGHIPAMVEQPMQTAQVAQPVQEAAPERTWRPRPLPVPATPFLGRELELAQIAERLADPNCRLLTLLGPGGIGKTRLALQVAAGHQPVFADGVAYVSLAGLEVGDRFQSNPAPDLASDLAGALAGALNAPFRDSEDAETQLVAVLRPLELLLVIDNFEYLVGEAELLADLLAAAPRCKILLTSRQQVDLVEEWVYELQGLPLPTGAADEESSALALFERSASRSSRSFVLDDANRAAAAEICRLVGGLPLAIELAAGWVRLLSCAEIAAEVARSLDVLAASQRNIPERHRSMRAVFDYSWRLLSAEEQDVLAALSLFAGGFGRDGAQSVARAGLPMLMALAAKSLVQRVDAGRYTLHELVRQYAQERLAGSPAWAAVRERHLAYVAGLAETARDALYSAEQRQWLERLELEHDNMRVALEWAFGDGGADQARRAETGLRLVAGIPRFWNGRGHLREGVAWLERGLAAGPDSAPPVRAEALSTLGWLVNMLGDTPRAKQLQLESLALCRACGDERGMAEALDALGDSAWFDGALDEAKAYYTEGLALRRRLGSSSAIGLALYSLGRLEVDHGSVEEAQPLLEEALDILRRAGDPRGVALALNGLGRAALRRNEPAVADRLIRDALVTFAELGNRIDIPECLEELAIVAAACGHDVRAAWLLGAASAMRDVTGARFSVDEQAIAHLLLHMSENPEWQAALVEGNQLSQEKAVAYALSDDCLNHDS
ncbi:MAG: BTAD domain-containing putative transcriptional regulator [Caldilineaceae bacterium]